MADAFSKTDCLASPDCAGILAFAHVMCWIALYSAASFIYTMASRLHGSFRETTDRADCFSGKMWKSYGRESGMRVSRGSLAIISAILLVSMFLCSGCAYLANRGNDALDVLDIGVTASKDPKFALYASDFSIISIGYSNVDGTLVGIGGREVGAMPVRHHAGAVVLYGYERFGYEDFDMQDPDSPEKWRVGLIGLLEGPLPPKHQFANVPRMLHLGWIGLALNIRFGELADFILGLTTIDIMHDDTAGVVAANAPAE